MSLFFYAWGEPRFVAIMICSIVLNWLFALIIYYKRDVKLLSKLTLIITVVFNIGLLFIYKYFVFTLESLTLLFNISFTIPVIVLPIGISFFTFQAMSYVIDVYREKSDVQKNLINVALYISFFPQLIAGPIVRYNTIAEQIDSRKETIDLFSSGCLRFMSGFSKKILLANSMGFVADRIFVLNVTEIDTSMAWLGLLAYTFQIFFDFSAYSDMAIGLGRMFGFNFSENFNYPYISKTVTEFWRRWHISLGTWFKDYVYIPLGGSRVKSKYRLAFNLFIVWILTGIWHGANYTFILWGLMYYVLLAVEKILGLDDFLKKSSIISRFYTLFFVMIGWMIFRSPDIAFAFEYLKKMFFISENFYSDITGVYVIEYLVYFFFAFLLSTPIMPALSKKYKDSRLFNISTGLLNLFLFAISIVYLINSTYNPFIYFNF